MAVNEPSLRAKPEDRVCLRHHKSLAIRYIISHLIGPFSVAQQASIETIKKQFKRSTVSSSMSSLV